MPHRIQVTSRDDPEARRILAAAATLGVDSLTGCTFSRVHHVDGQLTADDLDRLCRRLLADPIVDDFSIGAAPESNGRVVEVAARAGVTDSDARALEDAAAELGMGPIRARSARRYELFGALDDRAVALLSRRLLANETIEIAVEGEHRPDLAPQDPGEPKVDEVELAGLDPGELLDLSRERGLSLDAEEMKVIQSHFAAEGRAPTDAEIETLAQTWSEHCVHKTFRALIELRHIDSEGVERVTEVDGLLAELRRVTEELAPPWLRSAFVDNAGIVELDETHDLAFKVETHNHPSALEPFGGANTGVGGVVRDVIGVSARPIACTDVLCFGPSDLAEEDLPDGVLHPRRIRAGVVSGVGDYGNKLGLPTVNGAVLYDRGYVGNPLVYCGALGILPRGSHPTSPSPGDLVIAIGGRTGRDGIRGATFSSAGMDASTVDTSGSAVQIGDPITEKGCIEVVERARDERLYTAITDCGAGGFSSAVGEMGSDLGVEVDLSTVPLKYAGLQPWEIWLSEAQERMVLAVPPTRLARLRELCEAWDVELTDLGVFTDTGRLVVHHADLPVVDLPMSFLHDGLPRRRMSAVWSDPGGRRTDRCVVPEADPADLVLRLLAHPDVASKETIVRTYDHEVRGGTVIRPMVGPASDGPGDAAVIKPLGTWHHERAVVLAAGINPRLGKLDPYLMALAAIDEAVRNLVAVGGDPERVALLDNFCWGDPTRPDRLGGLVRAVQGCVDGARRYRMPFISGKDSLYNEFDGRPIPGTLLISALGLVPDLSRATTSAVTTSGDDIWLVGDGSERLGGSLVDEVLTVGSSAAPDPVHDPLPRYRAVHELIREGRVRSAHDCSEGGLAVAAAEMALGGRLGVAVTIADHGAGVVGALFNEAPGRILLATDPADRELVAQRLVGFGSRIGEVTGNDRITLAVTSDDTSAVTVAEVAMADAVGAFAGEPNGEF